MSLPSWDILKDTMRTFRTVSGCPKRFQHLRQYMLFFGATANCIPWVYVPEILPLHVRAKGTAIGISANWLWNFCEQNFITEGAGGR